MPTDEALRAKIVDLSQHLYFKDQYGYVLGFNGQNETGLPHITLCQFDTAQDSAAKSLFTTLKLDQTILYPMIQKFSVHAGEGEHRGAVWLAYDITLTEDLILLQKHVVDALDSQKWTRYTDPQTYTPHITIARLSHNPRDLPSNKAVPLDIPFAVRPVLGRSSPNGVLLNPLLIGIK